MLHHDFIHFLQKCNEYNFSVNVLSNLTLLTEDIIREMKRNPLLGVQTSLYSMDANVHDSITKLQGSFEKTTSGIIKLVENNIPLQISCPIMKQNLQTYAEVIDWGLARNINVSTDYVMIAKYDHSIQNLENRLSLSDVNKIIIKKANCDSAYLKKIQSEAEEKANMHPGDPICSICHSSICVSENGQAYPCAGWQDYNIGDLNAMSLKDIWEHSDKIKYLRGLRRSDFPQCIECQNNKYCTMCLVRNANEEPSGNPLKVNEYFCKIAELQKDLVFHRYDNI